MPKSLAKLSVSKIRARQGIIPMAFMAMLPSAISTTLGDIGFSPSKSPVVYILGLLSFILIICAITWLPRIMASPSSVKMLDIIPATPKRALLYALLYTVAISIFNILALQIQSLLVSAATHPMANILPELIEENTRLRFVIIFLSILCFLPVIILIARTFLAPLLITEPRFNLRKAVDKSWTLTRKQTINIALTLLVPLLILSLGINIILRSIPEALDVDSARIGVLVLGIFLRGILGALALSYWAATVAALFELRTSKDRHRLLKPKIRTAPFSPRASKARA